MSSELNLAELPVEVLLDIFRNVAREDTKTVSLRTTLRLVCSRFNNIISDPNNNRPLSEIRMKIEKITIAQFGSALAIRAFHGTSNEQTAHMNRERIYSYPEIPLLKSGRENPVPWRWIDITRSFILSLMECLNGYPRIHCINFDLYELYNMENIKIIKAEFGKDIDVGIMAKFASNFRALGFIPKRFNTFEFIEKLTNGPEIGDFGYLNPFEDSGEILGYLSCLINANQLTPISLHTFSRFWAFQSIKFSTTLDQLINAIELRIKIGKLNWEISLSDEEWEIRNFMQKNNRDYQEVEPFNNDDALRLMKLHQFNGVYYSVLIIITRRHEVGCYHAKCLNRIIDMLL
uniref:F-box domain-containing protein n=1 Tax=Pristionchus pacificus TaxID=54126 RepID=A0A8R1UMH0_PRIPA